MSAATTFRGKPLIALSAIMLFWIAVRAAMWEYGGILVLSGHPAPPSVIEAPAQRSEGEKAGTAAARDALERDSEPGRDGSGPIPYAPMTPRPAMGDLPLAQDVAWGDDHSTRQAGDGVPVRTAAGHQLLWMAALSKLPLPAGLSAPASMRQVPAPFYPVGRKPLASKRWSADSWLMLRRRGAASLATGAAPATYGASQFGAVLRYRLAKSSSHKPAAYARVTASLGRIAEKEAAFGVSARPLVSVPVVAAVELRASDQPGGRQIRPAAMVVTEIRPIDLPYGTRAEFYGQAGYVGGTYATAFADGQLRIDTKLADLGKAELRVGAGSWAGVQKGASRVDVGPTATMGIPISNGASARLGVDWRVRVTGNAEPESGPAITLSAGF